MKEFEVKAKVNGLTSQVVHPTLEKGGNIFMAEPGGGEIPKDIGKKSIPQKENTKPEKPQATGPVKDEGQLIPTMHKDTETLTEEYKTLINFLKQQREKGESRAEEYAQGISPRINELGEELRARGINTNEISAQAHGPGSPAATNQEYLERLGNLRDQITNPEFRAIINQIINNPDIIPVHFEALVDRHKELLTNLLDKIGQTPAGPEGDLERVALNAELERLETEFSMLRRTIITAVPERERGIDEADRKELDEIEGMPEGDERNKAIRDFMKKYVRKVSPEDEPIADRIMRLIAEDEVATEEFISRLIVDYIENEPWAIKGFYGNINFEKFTRVTRNIITGERRDRLLALIDANSAFHTMNYILKRSFESFPQHSESLLPEQFVVLSKIPGVDDALTLYEELYAEVRSEETLIIEEMARELDRRVEAELKIRASEKDSDGNPKIRGMGGEEMEDWEISRAFIYARNFFRITIRAAEQTTLSELPRGDDPSLYVSSPQTKLAQVLNIPKSIGIRFRIEKPLGGPEMIAGALKYNSEKRKENGVRIKTLQGTSVDMREFQGIIAARGVFASWRNAEVALRQISFKDEHGKVTNVVQFFLDHSEQIAGLAQRSGGRLSDSERSQLKQDTQKLFEPLLNNTSIALGLLASPSGLSDVTSEFKELIWEKIVALDPAVMASLLTRLEMDDEDLQFIQNGKSMPEIEALEDILLRVWGTDEQKRAIWGTGDLKKRNIESLPIEDLGLRELKIRLARALDKHKTDAVRKEIDDIRQLYDQREQELKGLFRDEKWQGLLGKLRRANKIRVNEESVRIKEKRFGETPKGLDEYFTGDLALSDEEQRVLAATRENGRKITRDLANIRVSQAWFLDDVPFKDLNWLGLGNFYDRETGDLANFNRGGQGLLKVISNPFGQKMDEVLDEFKEGIDGAGMVLGRIVAQDNQEPFFVSWCRMIYEKPAFRQLVLEMAMHTFKRPTSRAQEIVGMEGLAVNEDGMQAVFDKSLPRGILRKEVKDEKGNIEWSDTYNKIRKQFHTMWYNIGWGKFRDYGPIGIIAFLIQFFQSITKEKLS